MGEGVVDVGVTEAMAEIEERPWHHPHGLHDVGAEVATKDGLQGEARHRHERRPAEGAAEGAGVVALRHRHRRRGVDGAVNALVDDGPQDDVGHVVDADPRHEGPPVAEGPAETGLEERQHLAKGAAARRLHDADPQRHRPRPGTIRRRRRRCPEHRLLPGRAEVRQRPAPRRARLVEDGVATLAVEAHRRRTDDDRRRPRQAGEGAPQERGLVDALPAQAGLLLFVETAVGDALTGEVRDGVETGGGGDVDGAARRMPRYGARRRRRQRRWIGHPHEGPHLVAEDPQQRRELPPDQAAGAGDADDAAPGPTGQGPEGGVEGEVVAGAAMPEAEHALEHGPDDEATARRRRPRDPIPQSRPLRGKGLEAMLVAP
jgi:hypothetical protein